jgi:hypothetical protein
MQTDDDAPESFRMAQTIPQFTRLMLAGFGLFALFSPAMSFGSVLFQPTLFVLPFWVIVLGAAAVGGAMLLGAVAGDATVLEIDGRKITLSRRNPLRSATRTLSPGDILSVGIRTIDWDSRPETFAVEMRLRAGPPVGSDDFARREDAEALAARLRAVLSRAERNLVD